MSGVYSPEIVGMVKPEILAAMLSAQGDLTAVLKAAAEMYGFELVIDDDVAGRMRAKASAEGMVANHIAKMLTAAHLERGVWLDYNVTFRLGEVAAELAVEGLVKK